MAVDPSALPARITFRAATPADADVLAHWDTLPHVIAAVGDSGAPGWPDEIASQGPAYEILVFELDGRPLGVVQIIDPALEPTHYWGNVAANLRAIDIWIGEAGDLGRGYGTEMMRLALDRCFAPPEVTAVLIDPLVSNMRAHRFYRRIGFEEVGEQTFDTDHCLVHRIDRATWAAHTG